MHRDAKNKSLRVRGISAMIICKSDEMKGYRVYITKEGGGVVTQHVRNLGSLTPTQSEQLRRVHLQDPEGLEEKEGGVASQGTLSAAVAAKAKGKGRAESPQTRNKYHTRSASRKAVALASTGDSEDGTAPDVVNIVREADQKNNE